MTNILSFLRCCILFILILCSFISNGQSKVKGQVLDKNNNPLAYANVLVINAIDSVLYKAEFTDDDGNYTIDGIEKGRYFMQCSMVGYDEKVSQILEFQGIADEIKTIDAIILDDNVVLQAIEIVAKRPFLEQKVDRTVVNVSNSITNAGGNALEVLQRSPGIQINRFARTISLSGKQGIIIMINGKVSRMPNDAILQMLEGTNAANIERIELIHTPPANFEAEGNAGIINIVLKNTGDEGFNGSYALNVGRGRGDKYGANFNFNYRKNKFNLFGSYDRNYNLNPQLFTTYRGVTQNDNFFETDIASLRNHTPTTVQNARLGLDFAVSNKTVIGLLATFFDRNWYMEAVNEATYSTNNVVTSRLKMPNKEKNQSTSYAGNFNISHKFTDKQSLNFDADLIRLNIDNPSSYSINLTNDAQVFEPKYQLAITKKTPIHVAVAKLDYTNQVSDKISFETGVKYTQMRFDNNVQVDSIALTTEIITLAPLSSMAKLNENVTGSYFSFSAKLNKDTDFKAGLRYEYTNTNLDTEKQKNIVDRHYGSWFPSVFFTHRFSESDNVNVSYSKRIMRPQINDLAPWLIFVDPSTQQAGNPSVQPSFSDTYKIDYGLNAMRFTISYSIEKGAIRYLPGVDAATNRQVNAPANIQNEKISSFNYYLPFSLTSWWSVTSNVFLNHMESNIAIKENKIKLSNLVYGINGTNTFKLTKSYTLEVSGFYYSPGYWGIMKWQSFAELNTGIQKEISETWGKLQLSVNNLLLSNNWFGETNQPSSNLLVAESYQVAERVFMLTWSNAFGSKKLKSARDRQTGAAEERRRL